MLSDPCDGIQTNVTQASLKRDVGLLLFAAYGIGNIIGAGIYVLIGKVAGEAGYLAPFAFFLAAFIAVFTGLSYGELSARFPVSAGEAVYLHKAFNRRTLSMAVGLLIAAAGLVSAATMTLGFVGYFQVLFNLPDWVIIITIVIALTVVASRGIVESASVAALLTVIEVGGLVWIIAVAAPNVTLSAPIFDEQMVPVSSLAWQGVLGGAFLAFFAFIGFEDMVNIAEEVKYPERNLPLGILIAFTVSTVLYLLVAIVSIATVSPHDLAASDAPFADVYTAATGKSPAIISTIGLFAVVNGALIQIIMGARIFYGMSVNGWIPKLFSYVSPHTSAPTLATATAGAIVIFLALWLPLVGLARATSFMVLVVFVLINLSLIRIKLRDPAPAGIRLMPIWVPAIGMSASAAIIITSIFISR